MMWNWRMLAVTGEAKFTDVIERALYNGINSGMSLDGTLYCYRNPLAFDPSTGDKIRNTWYDTTCCPPNLERTFGSLPGYFYSTSADGIYVHLYDNSELNWHLENGVGLKSRTEDELSVGRQCGNHGDAGAGIRVHFLSADSRLGRPRASDGEWQGLRRVRRRDNICRSGAAGRPGMSFS